MWICEVSGLVSILLISPVKTSVLHVASANPVVLLADLEEGGEWQ